MNQPQYLSAGICKDDEVATSANSHYDVRFNVSNGVKSLDNTSASIESSTVVAEVNKRFSVEEMNKNDLDATKSISSTVNWRQKLRAHASAANSVSSSNDLSNRKSSNQIAPAVDESQPANEYRRKNDSEDGRKHHDRDDSRGKKIRKDKYHDKDNYIEDSHRDRRDTRESSNDKERERKDRPSERSRRDSRDRHDSRDRRDNRNNYDRNRRKYNRDDSRERNYR